jgi:hypothetical protein
MRYSELYGNIERPAEKIWPAYNRSTSNRLDIIDASMAFFGTGCIKIVQLYPTEELKVA